MKIKKHDIILWSITAIAGILSYWINYQRTLNGFFSSAKWIFWDGVLYQVFGYLLVAVILLSIIPHHRKK
jgi:hypothetical protein